MPPLLASSLFFAVSALLTVVQVAVASSNSSSNNTGFSSLADAFPQLAGLTLRNPSSLEPSRGGQDYDHCCLIAVNASLSLDSNGSVVTKSGMFIQEDGDTFYNSQFPCAASYIGDNAGAPAVTVPYTWCAQTCSGWQISKSSNLKQWVEPLVGFILPSVVFCLAIPRRRRLEIPDRFFPKQVTNLFTAAKALAYAIIAAIMVSLDTIFWLGVVFALSGPLLLSGLYEALLDKRIIDHMHEKIRNDKLSVKLRARILYAVLVGNLDLATAWHPTMKLANSLQKQRSMSPAVPGPPGGSRSPGTPFGNMNDRPGYVSSPLGVSSRSIDGSITMQGSTRELSQEDYLTAKDRHYDGGVLSPDGPVRKSQGPGDTSPPRNELELEKTVSDPLNRRYERSVAETKTRLKAMLACQYSFGSVVGAPVIFYIGSFIFALLQVNSALGDNDTSHALAFGMWWMGIPHLSIVSGCLLAGNNPNTLESIVSESADSDEKSSAHNNAGKRHDEDFKTRLRNFTTERLAVSTYEAHYQPAWMWERGRSKREWVMQLCHVYFEEDPREMRELRNALRMTPSDWVMLSLFAWFLLFTPCLFGFLTSYYTPTIGLACRSLTFLIYACTQSLLLLLWIWNFTWRDQRWVDRRQSWRREDQMIRDERRRRRKTLPRTASDRYWSLSVSSLPGDIPPQQHHFSLSNAQGWSTSSQRIQEMIFWPLLVFLVGVATFSAIGGRMFRQSCPFALRPADFSGQEQCFRSSASTAAVCASPPRPTGSTSRPRSSSAPTTPSTSTTPSRPGPPWAALRPASWA